MIIGNIFSTTDQEVYVDSVYVPCMLGTCLVHVRVCWVYVKVCWIRSIMHVHVNGVYVRVCQFNIQQGLLTNCCISPITQHLFIQTFFFRTFCKYIQPFMQIFAATPYYNHTLGLFYILDQSVNETLVTDHWYTNYVGTNIMFD